MKSFQYILKLLAGMLIGAAVGYGGVMLVTWLAGGGMPLAHEHANGGGVDHGLLALSIVLAMVWLVVSVVIHLLMHEAGHLVMGLLTGFRFLSFRVFKFTLVKTDEGLQWKRFHIAGTGGQCLLELPEDQDVAAAPWFWYNAGGVLMNLLLAALSIVVLRLASPGIVGMSFFLMMAFVGILMALLNGVPMMVGGVSNDGLNLWSLWRHPDQRRYFVHALQAAGRLSRGHRVGEMPREWFEDVPVTAASPYLELSNRSLYMALLEDQMRLDEAREVAEEMMALGKKLPQLFRMEVGGERVMLELLTTQRQQVVDELWDKQLARYTEVNSKYSPMKCAVLYVYERFHNLDNAKADTYRQMLEAHQCDYTMPGEGRTAIALVEKAQTLA